MSTAEIHDPQPQYHRKGTNTMNTELQGWKDLADARELKIKELQGELQQLQEHLNTLDSTAVEGVDVHTYVASDADVVQIDTQPGLGNMRVYLNDGLLYSGDPEERSDEAETETEQENAEAPAPKTQSAYIDEHLAVASGGAAELVKQLESRGPIQRAAYVATIGEIAELARRNATTLDELHTKAQSLKDVI